MQTYQGKVAVITGGASGIGHASARWFAERGAIVVLADRNEQAGREAEAALRGADGQALFVPVDIGDSAQVERLFQTVQEHFGRLDFLVNAAGISPVVAPIGEYPVEAFDQAIAINLGGTFYAMRFGLPLMLAGGGGAVVNIASMMGEIAHPGGAAYVSSKHGVVGLTKAAALDYGRQGIRVNAVGPGVIKTPMTHMVTDSKEASRHMMANTPLGRFGEPEEVARLIGFLCSEDASFITGAFYLADGGYVTH